jgi:hypothetical protein
MEKRWDLIHDFIILLENGENGKHQYKVVKFSQSINNFIQAELW